MIVRSRKLSTFFTWVGLILFPPFLLFICEYTAYGGAGLFFKVLRTPLRLVPALLLIALLYYALVFATRRLYVSAIVTSLPFLIFAAINYFKMEYSVVPFVASDFVFAANIGNTVSEFTGSGLIIPGALIWSIFAIIAATVALALLCRKAEPNKYLRIWGAGLLFIALLYQTFVTAPFLYNAVGIDINGAETAAVGFKTNGFLTTFFKTLYKYTEPRGEISVEVPVSEDDFIITEHMQDKPNVVIVLSEAFWDPKQLTNVQYSENPTENFDRLSKEGISGTMLSPTIGGGTVRSEFEILTSLLSDGMPEGNSAYDFITAESLPSLGSYFAQNGYETTFMHTYEKEFYDRNLAYPKMGIDTMYDIKDIPYDYKLQGGYVPDSVLSQWVIDKLSESDKPQFIMAITIENHGPYEGKDNGGDIHITGGSADDKTKNMLGSFSKSVKSSDDMLGAIADYAMESGDDTVILWYGDHLPYLGAEYHGFVDGGFLDNGDEASWDEQTQDLMHACPFLIWSSKGDIEPVSDIRTAPYLLGHMLLEAMNAPLTTFYEFTKDYSDTTGPVRIWTQIDDAQRVCYDRLKAYTDIFLY